MPIVCFCGRVIYDAKQKFTDKIPTSANPSSTSFGHKDSCGSIFNLIDNKLPCEVNKLSVVRKSAWEYSKYLRFSEEDTKKVVNEVTRIKQEKGNGGLYDYQVLKEAFLIATDKRIL